MAALALCDLWHFTIHAFWQMRSVGFPSLCETIRIESRPWLLTLRLVLRWVWRSGERRFRQQCGNNERSSAGCPQRHSVGGYLGLCGKKANASWVCPQLTCSSQSGGRKRRQTSPLVILIGYRVNDRVCLPATSDDWRCVPASVILLRGNQGWEIGTGTKSEKKSQRLFSLQTYKDIFGS